MESTRAARIERRLAKLESQLDMIVETIEGILAEREDLWNQLSELNLRIMFTMQMIQGRKEVASPIVGAPPSVSALTMYDCYMQEREKFAKKVAANVKEIEHAKQTEPADGADDASRPPDADADEDDGRRTGASLELVERTGKPRVEARRRAH